MIIHCRTPIRTPDELPANITSFGVYILLSYDNFTPPCDGFTNKLQLLYSHACTPKDHAIAAIIIVCFTISDVSYYHSNISFHTTEYLTGNRLGR